MAAGEASVGAPEDEAHACCFYDTDEEQQRYLTGFVREGLAAGRKVVCVGGAASTRRILDAELQEAVAATAVQPAQLVVLGSDETYVERGFFDPDRMLARWSRETDRAFDEGFTGLHVTGDVAWCTRDLPGVERLMEYEEALNALLPRTSASALCLYDPRRLDDMLLDAAAAIHSKVIGRCGPPAPETFRVLRVAPATFRLLGELDIASRDVLSDVLHTAVADGAERLSLELQGLRFLDAAGASCLFRPVVEHGVTVRLSRPQPIVRRVLSILGADRMQRLRLEAPEA